MDGLRWAIGQTPLDDIDIFILNRVDKRLVNQVINKLVHVSKLTYWGRIWPLKAHLRFDIL